MKARVLVAAGMILLYGTASAQEAKFDGDYGNPNGIMGTGSACGTTRFGFRLIVRNGQASLRTVTAGVLEGKVGPDGAVQMQSGPATLNGKIQGPKFNGDLSLGRSGNCRFALDYTKF